MRQRVWKRCFIGLLLLGVVFGCCSCANDSGDTGSTATPSTENQENVQEEAYVMTTITNPIAPTGNDPWVIYHEEDGYYYYCYSGKGGICIAKMEHFYDIGTAEAVKVWTPPEGTEYSKELWAPELHYIQGEWYVYVACDDGDNANHRMFVLKGTTQDPTDPFEFVGKITDETDRWAIDGTVMEYNDKLYFVWSGWPGKVNITQQIYIAEMSDPCTISSKRVLISYPEYDWELQGGGCTVNEGPVAISHNGTMHIVYSASGSWCDDYCLGLLTLTGDDPLDKDAWTKASEPLLAKSDAVFGPGHCSFTTAADGSTWVIYHANLESGSGWGGRSSWAQKVTWDENNYPVLGEPVKAGVEMEVAIGKKK